MRQTLRRSCAACAKAKHSCDLRTPRCSRCIKRDVPCFYANQPWRPLPGGSTGSLEGSNNSLARSRFGSLDPFDSYPPTRLSRDHVQRLIYNFLHKIAFQYYPLDLNTISNPFLVSWWPLALGDPALFHVSLQTACLDEELLAQRGFQASEILMADSVALLRRKVEDRSLAVQDGTMNSIITLALIEFGKGNIQVAEIHVDGVKKLVDLRGGINSVRQSSPLTARMVSWVSMLIMGNPQFITQDDLGIGDGIPPIPEWQLNTADNDDSLAILTMDIDPDVRNVFMRLRRVFKHAQEIPLSTTRFHDLTCFVVHRLSSAPGVSTSPLSPITECIRYAIVLYMLTIHGPTYFPHAVMSNSMVVRLVSHLEERDSTPRAYDSLDIWILGIGMVASMGTSHYEWFLQRAKIITTALSLDNSQDVMSHMKSILWLDTMQAEDIFRPHWDAIFSGTGPFVSPDLAASVSSRDADAGLLL